jgi:hypothetical protein
MTNFWVNASLGFWGLYYFKHKLTKEPSLEEQIVGWESFYPLGCLQLGYQIWAIPVGVFVVHEAPEMIVHHFAVILVSYMAVFLRISYNYFMPFMFGMLELSSLPLAIMNLWKDHPKWIEKSPSLYTGIRLTFCATFLYIRWYMYLPRKYDFLRLLALTLVTSDSWAFRIYYSLVAICSLFLAVLQIWWGSIIVKSLVRFAFGKSTTYTNGKKTS